MPTYDETNNQQNEQGDEQEIKSTQLSLTIQMDDTERNDLAHRVKQDIKRYEAFTDTRRGNVQQWRRDVEVFPTGRSTRWKNSSDVPAPLSRLYSRNHHTRL